MNVKRIVIALLAVAVIIVVAAGLYRIFKKPGKNKESAQASKTIVPLPPGPYKDSAINLVYHLLFCDNLELYKANAKPPYRYPLDILFSETSSTEELQKIADDPTVEPRAKILACNRLIAAGHKPVKKEIIAIIVEVGLENGLDVLASFSNGTARYINHTGNMLAWDITKEEKVNQLTRALFQSSQQIIQQIGPSDKPRKSFPAKGNTRITFLVTDGLYFGEGPTEVMFNDPMAAGALSNATELMHYLTEKASTSKSAH